MAFMEPEVTNEQAWVMLEGPEGTEYLTQDAFAAEYGQPGAVVRLLQRDITTVTGYGVRLSAPGFLDCTEWEVFSTEAEAQARACELAFEREAETC